MRLPGGMSVKNHYVDGFLVLSGLWGDGGYYALANYKTRLKAF